MRIFKRPELKLAAALSAGWLLAACSTGSHVGHTSHHKTDTNDNWQPNYIKLSDYQPPTSIPTGVGEGCEFQYRPIDRKQLQK